MEIFLSWIAMLVRSKMFQRFILMNSTLKEIELFNIRKIIVVMVKICELCFNLEPWCECQVSSTQRAGCPIFFAESRWHMLDFNKWHNLWNWMTIIWKYSTILFALNLMILCTKLDNIFMWSLFYFVEDLFLEFMFLRHWRIL